MVYWFETTGFTRGSRLSSHGQEAIEAWLRGLGVPNVPWAGYPLPLLPDRLQRDQTEAQVRAFVEEGLGTAAVRAHLHSPSLFFMPRQSLVMFDDMLSNEEWTQREHERRFEVARIARAHQLPCELAEMIARYLI